MNLKSTSIYKTYKWLDDAQIYNKNNEIISSEWIENNADIVALLFTAQNIDKDGIITKFYEIYENVKLINIPIEVIYVPMDETEESARNCYENQANWFTLKYSDPLIPKLMYLYEVSSIPHLLILKPDGTIISRHGILDLEEYGKNAIICWLPNATSSKNRRFNKELSMYAQKWTYLQTDKVKRKAYNRKFSEAPFDEEK